MSCASACPTTRPAAISASRISPTAAFYLLASITITFLAGSSAPTPLYPLYQAKWAFSPITVTVVFSVYAIGLLGALLIAGRLSDHVGRRPVLVAATLAHAVTMLIFSAANGVADLLIARVIQGLSAGAAIAAVGAGMLDLDKARGTLANAVTPALGTATGGIVSGLMVHFLPAPTHLVFLVLGVTFLAQAVGVVFMTETGTPRPGALASLKPRFSVPGATRKPLLIAVPALVAPWALAGFYGSLGPALMQSTFGLDASLFGGLALFILGGSASVSIFLLQRYDADTMTSFGASLLLAGVTVAMFALSYQSSAAFFLGTVVAGAGFGTSVQGAIRIVVPFAPASERAGVLSVIFVVSYLAMGAPAVVAGYLVAHGGNIDTTAREFGATVMMLAALALLGAVAKRWK
jgi:predicted MFS family arabinose efflux permease